MTFGDLNDPRSEIAKAIAKNAVQAIKPDMGTDPQTYYIGLEQSAVEAKKIKEE
jgi:Fe-S-cluster-containing dehydrogenase component